MSDVIDAGNNSEYINNLRKEFVDLKKGELFDRLLLEYQTTKPACDLYNYVLPHYLEDKKIIKKKELIELKNQVREYLQQQESKKANELIVTFCRKWYPIKSIQDDNYREMFIYENGIYKENAQTHIKKVVRFCLNKSYTDTFANKVISKIEVDTYIDREKFYKVDNPYEVAVLNGILNLKTGEVAEYTYKKIFFNKIAANYDKKSQCPNFKAFLSSIFIKEESEDNTKLMFELIGFCLVREYFLEKAFLFQGTGRNGKGKLLNVISHLIGEKNISSLSLEEIKYDGFNLSNLNNKLINIGGDIGSNKLKSTQAFKSATGRDILCANRKNKSFLHFVNFAKMIFNANSLPDPHDDSVGFFDRWIFIDFPFKFVSESEYNQTEDKTRIKIRDPNIINSLTTPEELNGILNESVKALQNLIKKKEFTVNQTSTEIQRMWQIRMTSFTSFVESHITPQSDDDFTYIEVGELNKHYERFCLKNKAKKQNLKDIEQILWQKFGSQKEVKKISGKTKRVYPFIKFKGLSHQQNLAPVQK